jgi:hypothetical protein
MSISSEIRRAGPFAGNGSTVNFPFTFKVFTTAQVVVTRTVSGVETVLTLTTDYTVSLNSNQDTSPGGTVTMLTAPASGQSITITSNVANLQPTVLANLGGFYPEVINDSLDRATIQIQQLDERVDRALVIPVSSSGISTQLPAPQSNNLLGWNAGATQLVNFDPDNLALGLTYGSWTYQKFTGNGSQTAFVLSAVIASKYNVFITINGLTQVPDTDYSIAGSTVTFVAAPALSAEILARWGSTRYESDIAAEAELARDAAIAAKIAAELAETNAETAETNAQTAETNAETAETNAETAETGAVAARVAAEAARDAAQLSKGIFESTAAALGNGVQGHGAITGGSGGTNGTFPLITSGGTQVVPVRGTFVVAGGAVTEINVYYPGYYSSNPTGFNFAASSGLTSASATPTMGVNAGVGEYFSVPSTTPNELILYKVTAGPAATEVLRYPAKTFVDALTLFPGRSDWVAAETAALPRIVSLELYGANPEKYYFVKFLFWKDVGTRFNFTVSVADDQIGTNAADAASFAVGSGADVWAEQRDITLAEVGGSGLSGTAIIDFTSATAMTINTAPSTAAMFARRQITLTARQIGAARRSDIGAQAATALNIRNRVTQISAFAGGNAGNDTQTGLQNSGFGYGALDSLTSGADNSAFGYNALTAMAANSFATAVGSGALAAATGNGNTAIGYLAGGLVTTGTDNSYVGFQSAFSATTGQNNVGIGRRALFLMTTASFNTAVGASALESYTATGATAVGDEAGLSATTALNLTAIGRRAARSKQTGDDETYFGHSAGWSGQSKANNGAGNTGVGAYALGHNTAGDFNAACGRAAGWYGDTASKNAWLGYRCGYGLATGADNVGVGFYSAHNLNVGNRNTLLGSETDALIPDSTSMTATAVAGSGLSVGAYTYRVSFVIDGVETALSEPPKAATTTSGNQQINLASIPTYSGPRVCSARRVYRTPVSGENLYYLVGTLADNTTTTFSDTTADASLTTQPDPMNNSIAIGYGAKVLKPNQLVIGSTASSARITDVAIGGGVDDASPQDVTMYASNASGTNVGGADLRIRGGLGTGSAQGGQVIIAGSPAGSSGATHNASVDIVAVDGRGFINIKETTSGVVPTPAAGTINLFFESGALKFRNSSGTVLTVTAT